MISFFIYLLEYFIIDGTSLYILLSNDRRGSAQPSPVPPGFRAFERQNFKLHIATVISSTATLFMRHIG